MNLRLSIRFITNLANLFFLYTEKTKGKSTFSCFQNLVLNVLLVSLFTLFISMTLGQNWISKASVPSGVGLLAPISFSINGKLYVGGGYVGTYATNKFYEYTPSTNSWTRKADIPAIIYSSGCFVINNKGYIVCGANPSLTNNVYEYNPTTDSWTYKGVFPGAMRMNSSGFSINGKGYVFGGFVGGSTVVNEMWEYDANINSWTAKANCPGPGRNGSHSVAVGNKALVGLGTDQSSNVVYTDMYLFDPVSNNYTAIPNCPKPITSGASFFINSKAYFGVGYDASLGSLFFNNSFWTYNLATNSWAATNNFNGPLKAHIFCEVVNGLPYIGCGDNVSGYMNDNWTWADSCQEKLHIGNDTILCNGQSLQIGDSISGAHYVWSSGDTTPFIHINNSGTYILTANYNNTCETKDTIHISFQSIPIINLGSDTSYCSNSSHILNSQNTNTIWNTGDTSGSITITQPGIYWGSITNTCGTVRDSVVIGSFQSPIISLIDTTVCKGDTLIYDMSSDGNTWQWSNGNISPIFTTSQSGIYFATVTNQFNCSSKDTFEVKMIDKPFDIFLYPDSTICNGEYIRIQISNQFQVIWQDGSAAQNYEISQTGLYYVTIQNKCGTITDSVNVTVENCNCNLMFPTAFSPNQDGMNDDFGAVYLCPVSNFNMCIYNRWGELVFKTNDINQHWDGKSQGINQPVEVYVYFATYTDILQNKKKFLSGNVTLIR